MSNDYPVEVSLLAVTGVGEEPLILLAHIHSEAEGLIEYASRLCVAKEGKLGARKGYIQDRIKQGHESVLEHASATFYIRASRVLTHELVRHRIASYSQRSQRYVNESEPRYITPPEFSRSVGTVVEQEAYLDFHSAMDKAWRAYKALLEKGIPKEIARYVLPNACETQIVMTMNFRELRHFIKLRTSKRSLPEMQCVAGKVREICKEIAPAVFEDL